MCYDLGNGKTRFSKEVFKDIDEYSSRFYCLAGGHVHTHRWHEALCAACHAIDRLEAEVGRCKDAISAASSYIYELENGEDFEVDRESIYRERMAKL